jgi:hypothetical protein
MSAPLINASLAFLTGSLVVIFLYFVAKPTDPIGLPGPSGPEGPKGLRGLPGTIELTSGPSGPPGFQGPTGPSGFIGPSGFPGDATQWAPSGTVDLLSSLEGPSGELFDLGASTLVHLSLPGPIQFDIGSSSTSIGVPNVAIQGYPNASGNLTLDFFFELPETDALQGPTGLQGPQGATGPSGPPGIAGTSLVGPTGSMGPTGAVPITDFFGVPKWSYTRADPQLLDTNPYNFISEVGNYVTWNPYWSNVQLMDSSQSQSVFDVPYTGLYKVTVTLGLNNSATTNELTDVRLVNLTSGQVYGGISCTSGTEFLVPNVTSTQLLLPPNPTYTHTEIILCTQNDTLALVSYGNNSTIQVQNGYWTIETLSYI